MPGRPKTHPDTTPQHPNRLSAKALDLLRRVVNDNATPGASADKKKGIYADNESAQLIAALVKRGLIWNNCDGSDGFQIRATTAGRALIESLDGKAIVEIQEEYVKPKKASAK